MDEKLFDELLASVKEADEIIKSQRLKKLLEKSPKENFTNTSEDQAWLNMKPKEREFE
ncbi:hypothetical protein [Zooshikella sp. RANM57]|uniref:hypothetical protein n=1 Tax=Zooshikella sp. RANM57 TaxID=3425863 RepID=UPI003D6DD36A